MRGSGSAARRREAHLLCFGSPAKSAVHSQLGSPVKKILDQTRQTSSSSQRASDPNPFVLSFQFVAVAVAVGVSQFTHRFSTSSNDQRERNTTQDSCLATKLGGKIEASLYVTFMHCRTLLLPHTVVFALVVLLTALPRVQHMPYHNRWRDSGKM